MGPKKLVSSFLIAVFALSLGIPLFAQTKQEVRDELSKARQTYIADRDKLHDQDRLLRIQWHQERAELYKQLKANPGDKAIQEKLNEGPKKFLADKKDVYGKLDQLHHDWMKTRADLGEKIKSAQ